MGWARGSAWRHALLGGATFVVFMVAFHRLNSESWTFALVNGLTSAVVFAAGAQQWWPQHFRRRETVPAADRDGGAETSRS